MDLINVPQLNDEQMVYLPVDCLEIRNKKMSVISHGEYDRLRSYRGDIKVEHLKREVGYKIFDYFFYSDGTRRLKDSWLYKNIFIEEREYVFVLKGHKTKCFYTKLFTEKDKKNHIEMRHRKYILNLKKNNLGSELHSKYSKVYNAQKHKENNQDIKSYALLNLPDVYFGSRIYVGFKSKITSYMYQKNFDKELVKYISSFFEMNSNVKDENELINARIKNYTDTDTSEFIDYLNNQTSQTYDDFTRKFRGEFTSEEKQNGNNR